MLCFTEVSLWLFTFIVQEEKKSELISEEKIMF